MGSKESPATARVRSTVTSRLSLLAVWPSAKTSGAADVSCADESTEFVSEVVSVDMPLAVEGVGGCCRRVVAEVFEPPETPAAIETTMTTPATISTDFRRHQLGLECL